MFCAPNKEKLFDAGRWPRRPYCSDDLETGVRIRPLQTASQKKYIQPNPPHLRSWLIFDIDRPGAALAWQDANLPPPTWAAINPENAHAHLAWGLEAPVLIGDGGRIAPLRYLAAIEAAYGAALDSDRGYSGLLTKNPLHTDWRTVYGPPGLYELGYLAEFVDLPTRLPKKSESIGLGRNCTLFDLLRQHAYKVVRNHKTFDSFQSHLNARALTQNADFPAPLDCREVWQIVKSVSKWVWRRFDLAASDKKFSQLQAARGRASGEARRSGSITESEPWVAVGVSRATWYRRKSGLIVSD